MSLLRLERIKSIDWWRTYGKLMEDTWLGSKRITTLSCLAIFILNLLVFPLLIWFPFFLQLGLNAYISNLDVFRGIHSEINKPSVTAIQPLFWCLSILVVSRRHRSCSKQFHQEHHIMPKFHPIPQDSWS